MDDKISRASMLMSALLFGAAMAIWVARAQLGG